MGLIKALRQLRETREAFRSGQDSNKKIQNAVKELAIQCDSRVLGCIGWGSLIGLLPFAGDMINVWLAMEIAKACGEVDPKPGRGVRARMFLNVFLDGFLGAFPLVGILFTAGLRCNMRNVRLLEVHLNQINPAHGTHMA